MQFCAATQKLMQRRDSQGEGSSIVRSTGVHRDQEHAPHVGSGIDGMACTFSSEHNQRSVPGTFIRREPCACSIMLLIYPLYFELSVAGSCLWWCDT